MGLIEEIVTIFENYRIETEVIVASVRHPRHVVDAALLGADIATIPASILEKMVPHPLTDAGMETLPQGLGQGPEIDAAGIPGATSRASSRGRDQPRGFPANPESCYIGYQALRNEMNVLRRFRGLIVFLLIAALLGGALVVGKNIFLRQVRNKIQASLAYSRIRLSAIPPSLILEDVRTLRRDAPLRGPKGRRPHLLPFAPEAGKAPDRDHRRACRAHDGRRPAPGGNTGPCPSPSREAIIRDGEISARIGGGLLHVRGLRALFSEKGDAFSFLARAEEGTLTPAKGPALGGALTLSVYGKGNEVTIQRAVVEGSAFVVKARGRLVDPQNPLLELMTDFNVETALIAGLLNLPFAWQGRAEGSGTFTRSAGGITFRSSLSSRNLVLNGVPIGRASGRLRIGGKEPGEVNLSVAEGRLAGAGISVRFGGGRVEGRVEGTRLDPIMAYAGIPWPVRSPVWGTFSIAEQQD